MKNDIKVTMLVDIMKGLKGLFKEGKYNGKTPEEYVKEFEKEDDIDSDPYQVISERLFMESNIGGKSAQRWMDINGFSLSVSKNDPLRRFLRSIFRSMVRDIEIEREEKEKMKKVKELAIK